MVLHSSGGGGNQSGSISPEAANLAPVLTEAEKEALINFTQEYLSQESRASVRVSPERALMYIIDRQHWMNPQNLGPPFDRMTSEVKRRAAVQFGRALAILMHVRMRYANQQYLAERERDARAAGRNRR